MDYINVVCDSTLGKYSYSEIICACYD